VSLDWPKRFLARHPHLKQRRQRPIAVQRKDANNVDDLANYFTKLEVAIAKYGIVLEDLWNMDETGFRVGCDRSRMVVTLDTKKVLKIADLDNRDYITFVEAISSTGETISPLLIVKGSQILDK